MLTILLGYSTVAGDSRPFVAGKDRGKGSSFNGGGHQNGISWAVDSPATTLSNLRFIFTVLVLYSLMSNILRF